MAKQKYFLPVAALALSELIWGLNTVFVKMGVQSMPISIFISIRILAASLIILPFAALNWKPLKRKDLYLLLLASVFTITLNATALNLGLTKTTAVNAAVIIMLEPILLFILSASFLKEGLNLKTLGGIVIALIGSLIVIGKPWENGSNALASLTGTGLILASIFCGAIGILICKPLSKNINAYQLSFMTLFPGVIPIALYASTQLGTMKFQSLTSSSVEGLVWSTVSIVTASFLFFFALRYKKAESVGVYQYLGPVATIVAAYFLLSEHLSYTFLVGASLVFAGVAIAEYVKIQHQARTLLRTQ